MKKAKLVLLLAILFGTASAFVPAKHGKSDIFYRAEYTGSDFTWVLIEGEPNGCSENEEHACYVESDTKPEDNVQPSGTLPGDYLP
jgi:hypothetical protein